MFKFKIKKDGSEKFVYSEYFNGYWAKSKSDENNILFFYINSFGQQYYWDNGLYVINL